MSYCAAAPIQHSAPLQLMGKKYISEDQKQESFKKTATEFEEMYLKHFFKHIMPKDREKPFSEKSQNEDMYQSLWIDFTAKHVAENGGIGVAKFVLKQLNKNQQTPSYRQSSPIAIQQNGHGYDITI